MFRGERGPVHEVDADPVCAEPTQVPDAVAPPPGNPRFAGLDGIRGVGALSVVVNHAAYFVGAQNTAVGRVTDHFDVSVAIFFLITGFLLYRPMFAAALGDAPVTPRRVYYRRRLLRIIPGYWVALLVLAPILVFSGPIGLPNILFAQIYTPGSWHSGIQPAWSVCVEMSFYLLLPWYAALLNRVWGHLNRGARRHREILLLVLLSAGSLALRAIVRHFVWNHHAVDPLPTTFEWFAMGMVLAVISVEAGRYTSRFRDFAAQHPWACWLIALAMFAATVPSHDTEETSAVLFACYSVIAALILAPIVFGGAGRLLRHPVIAWLGLVSYGIYLYHYPIMNEIHFHAGVTANFVLLSVVGIVAAVACAAASYYLVERPALRFKRSTSSRRRTAVTAPVAVTDERDGDVGVELGAGATG